MTILHGGAAFTATKFLTLTALGTGVVVAQQIGDPQLKDLASYGVGGALALLMFYFYRQQATANLLREQQNADQHAKMTERVLEVVQENSRVMTGLHQTMADIRSDQQQQLKDALRDGGRRTYDPPTVKS